MAQDYSYEQSRKAAGRGIEAGGIQAKDAPAAVKTLHHFRAYPAQDGLGLLQGIAKEAVAGVYGLQRIHLSTAGCGI